MMLLEILYVFRFGGWSLANRSQWLEDIHGTRDNLIVWYNNKAPHALPSYSNAISNARIRSLAKKAGQDTSRFGITTIVHPMTLTSAQVGAQSL